MKGMKGNLVKRLKSIPKVVQLKAQAASEYNGYVDHNILPNISSVGKFYKHTDNDYQWSSACDIRVESEDDKENIPVEVESSSTNRKQRRKSESPESATPLSEIDISSFRRPDLDSGTLFDPRLLAVFQQAVIEYMRLSEDPLLAFQEKRPPGCFDSVILYTTSLRGIRKTFDDCHSIRFLLESFRVVYFERDVSMHMEFRQELCTILGGNTVPPKLFVKGRYIGGAEEVLALHEQGRLRPLLAGVPLLDRSQGPCQGCDGVRFVVCFKCNGSHKLIADNKGESSVCPQCNENGLIVCPYCC